VSKNVRANCTATEPGGRWKSTRNRWNRLGIFDADLSSFALCVITPLVLTAQGVLLPAMEEKKTGGRIMKSKKFGIPKRLLIMVFVAMTMMLFACPSAVAAQQQVSIKEGTYYIKAVNGNAKGKVVYWNEDAKDQNICMMFEAPGGSHADNAVWYITKNRNFDDWYGIYLYRDYLDKNGNKDRSKRIEIDNCTGRDQPYLTSTKGPHVFCGAFGNQDDAFQFLSEKKDNAYTNLFIHSREDGYTFNRHKQVRAFHSDLIYINANKDKDNKNKLWELIPVNYIPKLSRTAPALSAQKNGKLKIKWEKLRDKIKDTKAWKNAKYIEIQYSTSKNFSDNVKTKKIKKGTVNKSKAVSKLYKLKRKKTWYVRARLEDKNGVYTNWSKTVTVKTK
jgi:hypothetical protein